MLTDWINEHFQIRTHVYSWYCGADWDGDVIYIGRNQYFVYHDIATVGILDAIKVKWANLIGKDPCWRI